MVVADAYLHGDTDKAWSVSLQWINKTWQGRGKYVVDETKRLQSEIGSVPQVNDDKDPRKILAEAITYFVNNQSRMDYPKYRREGLPMTSAHMECLVKEMNYRVKGTERFWNDGTLAEAILPIRAAAISDDDRLTRHLRNRPGTPFQPNVKPNQTRSTAA